MKIAIPVAAGAAVVAGLEASGVTEFMQKLSHDYMTAYANNFGDAYAVLRDFTTSTAGRVFFDAASALAAGYTAYLKINKKAKPQA